tara:strand:- start:101 stop:646 length:546 start_codon:yes stop_codon:yes gene_type:complete
MNEKLQAIDEEYIEKLIDRNKELNHVRVDFGYIEPYHRDSHNYSYWMQIGFSGPPSILVDRVKDWFPKNEVAYLNWRVVRSVAKDSSDTDLPELFFELELNGARVNEGVPEMNPQKWIQMGLPNRLLFPSKTITGIIKDFLTENPSELDKVNDCEAFERFEFIKEPASNKILLALHAKGLK